MKESTSRVPVLPEASLPRSRVQHGEPTKGARNTEPGEAEEARGHGSRLASPPGCEAEEGTEESIILTGTTVRDCSGHDVPGPLNTSPAGASEREWRCARCSCILGQAVVARAASGLWHRGVAIQRDAHGQLLCRWSGSAVASQSKVELGRCTPPETRSSASLALPAVAEAPASGSASTEAAELPQGLEWISERYVALLELPMAPPKMRAGRRAVAIWEDGNGYLCTIVGSASRGHLVVQFEDGFCCTSRVDQLRDPLDEPLFSTPQLLDARLGRSSSYAAALPRRSCRAPLGAPQLLGPLQRTLASFELEWRAADSRALELERGPVQGLYICRDFVSATEVTWLRLLFEAHGGWSMYNFGRVGPRGDLSSVMRRLDFGVAEAKAEGEAADRSHVQPLCGEQRKLLMLVAARLRRVFGSRLWAASEPNMLQLMQIEPGTCLGNHFDRRDMWSEGIASIAWSRQPGAADARGAGWTLRLERGWSKGKPLERIDVPMPPGSAYILTGCAQGCTDCCEQSRVAHEMCACCWTHGIFNDTEQQVRQSVILRVYDEDWGRGED